jgi:tetratricopeptide (TPR) repeat protein
LISAADGYHFWSERYDRELKDVFAIQEEIARAIAERLKITYPWSSKPLIRSGTSNMEAYQSYLKGHTLLYKRGPAISRALVCCQRAVDLDPDYALAWAALAECHTTLSWYGFAVSRASMPKAVEAARRAVGLDSSLAETHCALAITSLMGDWNRAEAEREFLRALQVDPKCTQVLGWYANYALTCIRAGKIAESVEAGRRAVQLDPESFFASWVLQEALLSSGQFEAAVAAGESAMAMSGRQPWSMAWLAVALADWGKASEAEALYCEMQARARREYVAPTALALAAFATARADEVIRYAHEAYATRDVNCLTFFSRHFHLAPRLYRDSRFREIIAQMGRDDWLRDT